jgi:hypothetical protein
MALNTPSNTNTCCPILILSCIFITKGALSIKEYLTTAEAATYSGISTSKLAKLRHNGTGCRYIRIGESKTKAVIRYKKTDLDQWMNRNLIKTIGGA